MHTLIQIQFPEQYSYAPQRGALMRTPPLIAYADVEVPELATPPEDGNTNPAEVVFYDVSLPTQTARQALIDGKARILWNGGVYLVTETRKARGDAVLAITAQYQQPYDPPEVSAVTIDGDAVTAGDDAVVVTR